MGVSSASRPSAVPRARFAGAGLAVFALLAVDSTTVRAGPAERPIRDSRTVAASSTERIVSPPAGTVTVQELINEAACRFEVPASWIAEVMMVESHGHTGALSPRGAIGLVQVMPETYAGLRLRYGLGADPWNPRDNVLAGAAYLRELYNRYGAPGFLAAYNAGPGRWDDYRLRGRPLASETVEYLARLGPVIGGSVLPLPTFAGAPTVRSPFAAPIFVALSTDPARVQAAAARARIVRIVEANASVVGRTDAIFVTRSRTVELPSSGSAPSDRATVDPPTDHANRDEAARAQQPSNPLFPTRSNAGSQR